MSNSLMKCNKDFLDWEHLNGENDIWFALQKLFNTFFSVVQQIPYQSNAFIFSDS